MNTTVTTKLNDVNIESVATLAEKIQQEPDVAASKWNASVQWKGGFRSEAKIREFATFVSDEPSSLGGTDTGPNPVEQVLAALGNCLVVGYAANATAAGIEIKNLSVEVEGNLDLHTFLGLKEENAGYNHISVKVHIDSTASPDELQTLHDKVTKTSPVGHTLSNAVPLKIELA